MAKSTSLAEALIDLDAACSDVLALVAKNVGARAPDHSQHADLSTVEIAVQDLRVALRNRK